MPEHPGGQGAERQVQGASAPEAAAADSASPADLTEISEIPEIYSFGLTDVGRRRKANEDSLVFVPDHNVFGVADGMGGHNAGDVASALTSTAIEEFFVAGLDPGDSELLTAEERQLPFEAQQLAASVHQANSDIVEMSRANVQHKGMGSTVVMIHVVPEAGCVHICHVGDSRCYRARGGTLEQLTLDHSVINEALALKPDLSEEILKQLPTNVVTRALGMKDVVQVDTRTEEIRQGDVFIICSDGLSGMISDDQILQAAVAIDDLEQLCQELIDWANEAGGKDNISVVAVRIGEPVALADQLEYDDEWEAVTDVHEVEVRADDEAEPAPLARSETLELWSEGKPSGPKLTVLTDSETPLLEALPESGDLLIGPDELSEEELALLELELAEVEKGVTAEDRCRHCGHWLFASHTFCVDCGASADPTEPAIPQAQPLMFQEAKVETHPVIPITGETPFTVRRPRVSADGEMVVASEIIDIVLSDSPQQPFEEMLVWHDDEAGDDNGPAEDRCNYCGTWLLAGNVFCTECGGPTEPFDEEEDLFIEE